MGYDYTDAVIPLKGLPRTEKLVLISLAYRAANEKDATHAKGECWPGFGKIAAETGLHRITVIDTVTRLESLGFIKKSPPSGDRRSNTYIVRMDKLVAASAAPVIKKRAKRGKLAIDKALRKASGCKCKGRTCVCILACKQSPCCGDQPIPLLTYRAHFRNMHGVDMRLNDEGELVNIPLDGDTGDDEPTTTSFNIEACEICGKSQELDVPDPCMCVLKGDGTGNDHCDGCGYYVGDCLCDEEANAPVSDAEAYADFNVEGELY